MNSMTFLQTGPMTTIQDLGRYGWQDKGVGVCGAMDELAAIIANRLVGNSDDAPVLEMTLMSDRIRFDSAGIIAFSGADMNFCINGQSIKSNKALYVCSGDILSGSGSIKGARAYMAVCGSVECDRVFESYSTDLKGSFGGISGRRVQKGDVLSWSSPISQQVAKNDLILSRVQEIQIPQSLLQPWYSSRRLRICLSPELTRFHKGAVKVLEESAYEVSSDSDRMGYRLTGKALKHIEGCDILSSPLTKGSVQIPSDGQPIIMMSDRQTTGGYTKIGQVIRADLPYLAQSKPGDLLSFEVIRPDDAITLYRELRSEIDEHIPKAKVSMNVYQSSRDFLITVDGRQYKVNVNETTSK